MMTQLQEELAACLVEARQESTELRRAFRAKGPNLLIAAQGLKACKARGREQGIPALNPGGAVTGQQAVPVAGHWVPETVLRALCVFATQWNPDTPWPSLRELLIIIHQAYSQEIQAQVKRARALQEAAMQSLQRRLANAEPMSWVLLRQRIAHMERQLSAARSEAEHRQGVRGGQEALKCTLERCMNLQRDLDSVAMENGQLKRQLHAAEQASAAQRVDTLPHLPTTAAKQGTTAASDSARLGELIPAHRNPPLIDIHMQQRRTPHIPQSSELDDRQMHLELVVETGAEAPVDEGAGVAALSGRAQGSGDTLCSSVEDALLCDAIMEWDALCCSVSACSAR